MQETTTAGAPEAAPAAPCSKTANAFAAIQALPATGKEDPFSTAAERSFDAPWCVEDPCYTCQPWLPGQPNTYAEMMIELWAL